MDIHWNYSPSRYYEPACCLFTFCCVSSTTIQREKLMVIKFDGLPSKCTLLILTGYNLTDWVSTTVWYDNYVKLALYYNIKQA